MKQGATGISDRPLLFGRADGGLYLKPSEDAPFAVYPISPAAWNEKAPSRAMIM